VNGNKLYWAYPVTRKEESYFVLSDKMAWALRRRGFTVTPLSAAYFDTTPTTHVALAHPDIGAIPTVAAGTPGFMTLKLGRVWGLTMYESTRLPTRWAPTLLRHCERILVPSPWCAVIFRDNLTDYMESHTDQFKVPILPPIHVVPLGIDAAQFRYTQRPNRDTFTFLCIADRGNRKGFDLVLQAFYKVFGGPDQTPDVRLIFKMIETPQSILHFVTHFPDRRVRTWRENLDDIAELLYIADCFLFPSRGEGYGLWPRQAAATGLPVICSDCTGMADEAKNWALTLNGTWVAASTEGYDGKQFQPNLDELCTHMRWVYDQRAHAREFGYRASSWVHEHVTWDHAADAFIQLFNQVAEDTRRSFSFPVASASTTTEPPKPKPKRSRRYAAK